MQNPNQVARALDEIAALLEFSGEPKFKVRAYRHAARVAGDLGEALGSFVEQARLQEIEGIGPALSLQIREIWNTGSSELLARLQRENPEGARELMQVEGLTPKRIRALHSALGVRTVEELRSACREGRVRTVPGFGPKTERRLLETSTRFLDRGELPARQIVLPTALELARFFERALRDAAERVEIAGSVRRGLEVVNAIDLVFAGETAGVFRHLAGLPHVLRVDTDASAARLSAGVELRLHRASHEEFGTTLFQVTGSDAHVASVRARAAELGAALNGPFASEHELYRAAELPFVPPELRRGADELSAASSFEDLVTLGDLVGMVHCHTTYSDGKDGILEMALAAHAAGMQYITITDHSPSAHYARGVTLDRLREQWDEIAAVQERVPIRILRGTEADILADGSLDIPDAVLDGLDVVIASIHARHRMDRAAMTARLVRAMSLPLFKIWGHGLGRILLHREPVDCDVPAVLDALAASQGAVEINSDPHRLDLPPEWLPEARKRGLRFVISADAHSTRGMGVLTYGVTMARRGGVRRSEVLNAEDAGVFARTVRPLSSSAERRSRLG